MVGLSPPMTTVAPGSPPLIAGYAALSRAAYRSGCGPAGPAFQNWTAFSSFHTSYAAMRPAKCPATVPAKLANVLGSAGGLEIAGPPPVAQPGVELSRPTTAIPLALAAPTIR